MAASVAIMPDGRHILAGGHLNIIALLDIETGLATMCFGGHPGWVTSLVMSPDGKRVVSGDIHGNVILWELCTGSVVRMIEGCRDTTVCSVDLAADGRQVVSCNSGGTIVLSDVESGKTLRTFQVSERGCLMAAATPDGSGILSTSSDDPVALWQVETGRRVRTWDWPNNTAYSIAISPDGRYFVAGGDETCLAACAIDEGGFKRIFVENGWIKSIVISPDGCTMISAASFALGVWDVRTGLLKRRIQARMGNESIALSPDGSCVAVRGGGKIGLFDVETGRRIELLECCDPAAAMPVVFSLGGRYVLSGHSDTTILVWLTKREKARTGNMNKEELGKAISRFRESDLDRWMEAREEVLSWGDEAVQAILAAYPPRRGPVIDETEMAELMVRLDSEDAQVRNAAKDGLLGKGVAIRDWLKARLEEKDKYSVDVVSSLEWLLYENLWWVAFEIGDIGRVRAVMVLLEMDHTDAAREALREYAKGGPKDWAAEMARRALKGGW